MLNFYMVFFNVENKNDAVILTESSSQLSGHCMKKDRTGDSNCNRSNIEQMESPEGYLVNNIDLLRKKVELCMRHIRRGMTVHTLNVEDYFHISLFWLHSFQHQHSR